MTPEILDGLTNAWVWAWSQTLIYGPGLAVAAGCVATSWACAKARDWRERRRSIRNLENFANHPANRIRKEDR